MGDETVKVQLPLYPPGAKEALIYAKGGNHLQTRNLTDAEHAMMKGELKAFFRARREQGGWVLIARTGWRSW